MPVRAFCRYSNGTLPLFGETPGRYDLSALV